MTEHAERGLQTAQTPLLSVENLTVEFTTQSDRFRAVDDVSFRIHEAETLALVGESGSGKSTVALAAMGLLPKPAARITGGRIFYHGQDISEMTPRQSQELRGVEIAIIFQDPLSALNPVYSVGSQIGEALKRRMHWGTNETNKEVLRLMDLVRIPDAKRRINDYPHQFSGGMRQRAMIALALALKPKLLIADEPTTALDVTVQAEVLLLLKELQKDLGMGLLLITHDLGVVAHMSTRTLVMYGGKIVEDNTTKKLTHAPAHPYTHALLQSVPRLKGSSEQLRSIPGMPPNLNDLPSGCRFHPRCPYAIDICTQKEPLMMGVDQQSSSACHRATEASMWNGEGPNVDTP